MQNVTLVTFNNLLGQSKFWENNEPYNVIKRSFMTFNDFRFFLILAIIGRFSKIRNKDVILEL